MNLINSERGSAVLDFLVFAVILQLPILLFAIEASQRQQLSFGLEAVARHGLRAHLLSPSEESTEAVISEIASQFGLDTNGYEYHFWCSPDPDCLDSDSLISLEVRSGSQFAIASAGLG